MTVTPNQIIIIIIIGLCTTNIVLRSKSGHMGQGLKTGTFEHFAMVFLVPGQQAENLDFLC